MKSLILLIGMRIYHYKYLSLLFSPIYHKSYLGGGVNDASGDCSQP